MDVTVVVQDTRATDVSAAGEVIRERSSAEPIPAPRGEAMALSSFLTAKGILIWDMALKKDDLLRELTDAALRSAGYPQDPRYLDAVRERESQGSTFFNEGAAFPHARISGLGRACVALGLTRAGVSDVVTDKPIECVFLILSPEEDPDTQIRVLGLAGRSGQDRQLMEKLRSAASPEDAFDALRAWELIQEGG